MATVTQFWTTGIAGDEQHIPIFQAYGTTLDWTWALGDGDFYWAFAVRPLQANSAVSVQAPITAISDNDLKSSHGHHGQREPGSHASISGDSR